MRRVTEGQYALGALTIFALWIFFILPFLYSAPGFNGADHGRPPAASEQPEPTEGHKPKPARNEDLTSIALTRGTPTNPLYVETRCDDQDRNSECNKGWWQKLWTDPVATFTGALFLATFFQVIFTWQALNESRKANLAARTAETNTNSALVISNRPYVFVRDFAPIAVGNPSQPAGWRCVVIWENSGATPTQNLRMRVNWGNFDERLTDDYDFPDLGANEGESAVVIPPRGQVTTTAFTLTFGQAMAIQNEQIFTYIWGWAEYSDIFPNTPRRRTEFCVRVLVSVLSTEPPTMMVEFRHHGRHNMTN